MTTTSTTQDVQIVTLDDKRQTQLEQRWANARKRAIEQGIKPLRFALDAWTCESTTAAGFHWIKQHGDVFRCTCNAGIQSLPCKHAAAVMMELEQEDADRKAAEDRRERLQEALEHLRFLYQYEPLTKAGKDSLIRAGKSISTVLQFM